MGVVWVGGGSGPGGHAGAEGVKQGRGQSACQKRACAVCTASVLWVSAAAAAWGWVPWGSSGCSSPGPAPPQRPRTLDAGIVAGGWRGGGSSGHSARGGARAPAWGQGAGGAGERPETRRGRRSGSQPVRPRSWPHLRWADGRRPCLALPHPSPGSRTGRCPRCPQRGLSAAERGVCAGRAAPSAGAPVMGR